MPFGRFDQRATNSTFTIDSITVEQQNFQISLEKEKNHKVRGGHSYRQACRRLSIMASTSRT